MARFITEAKFEDIPTPAVNLAKLCLLDAVGCAIYGTTRPLGKIFTGLVDELGGKPVARVLGTSIETNAVNAAMANGTLGHSEDFDDFTGGHQAVLLMPVVLAMGEEHRLSGKQALLSYIVGFDITLNVTHAMGEDHYGKGWHNTSSIGTLGSTAAAAKMLNLDEMQTRMALGIGASQAAGLRANFGTMTKPFHPGNACRAGVLAAKMAQKGYEANPDVMEHRFGYAAVYGEEMMNLAAVPRHLGNPWALMGSGKDVANGIAIKIWPCCGGTHGANTAITKLLKKNPFKAEDVASVDIVTTHEPSCMAPNLRWPKSGLQGKFSTWFTVAPASSTAASSTCRASPTRRRCARRCRRC
jgi:2-methylcitrate dehydratase PrpD